MQNEILDEVARKQDMQSPESINLELLDEMTSLTNGLMGIANGPKGSG